VESNGYQYPLDPGPDWVILLRVRQTLAAVLLFCVGILIPASASPVRFCLLEFTLNFSPADSKCCSDCNKGTELPDPCCIDLEEMPDSTAPQVPVELPPLIVTEVPEKWCPIDVVTWMSEVDFHAATPIRGPTSPAAYRAVLGIWRL
jgi:hypothetical protein